MTSISFQDLISENGAKWAVVKIDNKEVTFTLEDDGSLYLLNYDGGALQDTESDFQEKYGDREDYEQILKNINKHIKQNLCEN